MENNNQWYCSWVVIILALIIAWPVGVGLIFLRTRNSKAGAFSATSDKKVYSAVGGFLAVMGLIALLNDGGGVAFFMFVGGVVLIYYSNKLSKKAARNRLYIDLVINKGETNINKIATTVNASYDVVVKELKALQFSGVLRNASINEEAHTISIMRQEPKPTPMFNNNGNMQMGQTVTQMQAPSVVKKCPGCGAEYTGTKGTPQECDYCGKNFVF
ncbi:MAG: hypothetical protein ACI4HQ_01795 [Acetatifactor sp.]